MPELPEIETILRGIAPRILGQIFSKVIIRQPKLRWEIPKTISKELVNQKIINITRRGKYLLLQTENGTLIIHLGMSGRLLLLPRKHIVAKHEHITFELENGLALCYIDPRRFGAILLAKDPSKHTLLKNLGPEPLSAEFSAPYLLQKAKNRTCSLKQLIMNNNVVVGIGNIYACETLFLAHIRPDTITKSLSSKQCILLVKAIKDVLAHAISKNGTTFRDYATSEGKSGNFQNELMVYGKAGLPCKVCGTTLQKIKLGQRNTVFCPKCQK